MKNFIAYTHKYSQIIKLEIKITFDLNFFKIIFCFKTHNNKRNKSQIRII